MGQWHFEEVWRYRVALWNGMLTTVYLNTLVVLVGTALGMLLAVLRLSPARPVRYVARAYVDLFRSLPLLVLLVWFFFALPYLTGLRFRLEAFPAAVLGLSLNLSAFVAEIARAGIEAVPAYHVEAGRVAGFTPWQTWRHITGPIAFRLMTPPLFGQYINQIKLSVLASVIAVPELLHVVNTITTETFRPLELYTTLAVIFLAMLLPATWLQAHLESRSAVGDESANRDPAPCSDQVGLKQREKTLLETVEQLSESWPVLPGGSRLVAQELRCGYNGRVVLQQVSLVALQGAVTTLVGSNGSGKTTLLRCLCGILPSQSGAMYLCLGDGTVGEQSSSSVGYMSQEHEPWPHLTVGENLTLPLRIVRGLGRAEAEKEAENWLRLMGLENRTNDRPSELSGGQRQRLVFARTLCLRPRMLFLDEPTSAMDSAWTLMVQRIIRKLSGQGVLIVTVSHSLAFLRSSTDTVVCLDHGTIAEVGAASEAVGHPKSEALRTFLEVA